MSQASDPTANPPAVPDNLRADVWLWAVRLFKTRSAAAEACRGGKVRRGGNPVKPSTSLRAGDILAVTTEGGPREVRVESLPRRRLAAPLAAHCFAELTDPAVLAASREARRHAMAARHPGDGRPTKQDRREMDKLRDALRDMGYPAADTPPADRPGLD